MSTLSYHFPEFAIGAVRARIRSVRPWNPPAAPMELAVHSEPITFLSGRLPLLSAHRSTA